MKETNNALELVKLRNSFYKDNFRRMILILLVSVLLNVILVISLFVVTSKPPERFYFASTANGRIIPLYALREPVLSDTAVRSWVSSNVPQLYDLDFVHYRSQVQRLRGYFTAYGWRQFLHAFRNELEQVVDQKLITSASPSNVPIITAKGTMDGVYSWDVQIPLIVSVQKGDEQSVEHVVLRLILQRTYGLGSQQLLGISQIVAQKMPGPGGE